MEDEIIVELINPTNFQDIIYKLSVLVNEEYVVNHSCLYYNLDMKNSNAISFKGFYYAKSAIFASEIKRGVKSYMLDLYPNKYLKDIIENSPIFNDLKNKTDVYISSYIGNSADTPQKYTGHIRAIFKNPYTKQSDNIDSINLEATDIDEKHIFEKLKNISVSLPIYKNFTNKKFIPGLKMLLLGKDGCDGYIKKGETF